jgi:hypothetical protein
MFHEGNQIHSFMSSSGSGTVINYGCVSGSDCFTSYGSGSGSGSTSQKVTVPTVPVPVPVPQHCSPAISLSLKLVSSVQGNARASAAPCSSTTWTCTAPAIKSSVSSYAGFPVGLSGSSAGFAVLAAHRSP